MNEPTAQKLIRKVSELDQLTDEHQFRHDSNEEEYYLMLNKMDDVIEQMKLMNSFLKAIVETYNGK